MKDRYVVYAALRFTGGMAMVGFVVCFIIFGMYIVYQEIGDETLKANIWWNIGYFVVMGLLIVYAIYFDKKQRWHHYIMEITEKGWIHYIIKYTDIGKVDHDTCISPDMIVELKKYKKKYYKRKGKWYIQSSFGFISDEDPNKVYGVFFYGWIVEPADIKEYDDLFRWIKKKSNENIKRMNIKVPSSVVWYPVSEWENSEKARKIKEECEMR